MNFFPPVVTKIWKILDFPNFLTLRTYFSSNVCKNLWADAPKFLELESVKNCAIYLTV